MPQIEINNEIITLNQQNSQSGSQEDGQRGGCECRT